MTRLPRDGINHSKTERHRLEERNGVSVRRGMKAQDIAHQSQVRGGECCAVAGDAVEGDQTCDTACAATYNGAQGGECGMLIEDVSKLLGHASLITHMKEIPGI